MPLFNSADNAAHIVQTIGFKMPRGRQPQRGFEAKYTEKDFLVLLLKVEETVREFMNNNWQPAAIDKDNLNYQMRKGAYYVSIGVTRRGMYLYCEERPVAARTKKKKKKS